MVLHSRYNESEILCRGGFREHSQQNRQPAVPQVKVQYSKKLVLCKHKTNLIQLSSAEDNGILLGCTNVLTFTRSFKCSCLVKSLISCMYGFTASLSLLNQLVNVWSCGRMSLLKPYFSLRTWRVNVKQLLMVEPREELFTSCLLNWQTGRGRAAVQQPHGGMLQNGAPSVQTLAIDMLMQDLPAEQLE